MIKTWLRRAIGYGFTLAVFLAAIWPEAVSIPVAFRPWVFLASVIWIVVFSSGVINL